MKIEVYGCFEFPSILTLVPKNPTKACKSADAVSQLKRSCIIVNDNESMNEHFARAHHMSAKKEV